MSYAGQRFWALPEMQLEVAKYLDSTAFRRLVITSRSNHTRFIVDVWRVLTDIGNLFAILHEDLAISALGRGEPTVAIPPLSELEEYRIMRFLQHAELVQRLTVNRNPDLYIKWQRLDRLLALPVMAMRDLVMPHVTHFSIGLESSSHRINLEPLIRLVANNRLQQVWVAPNRSLVYPRSTLDDAEGVFQALNNAFGSERPLKWLSIYPEGERNDRIRRNAMVDNFLPLAVNLRLFTTSIWFISIPLLLALSQSPLERLEIQGRAPVPFAEMDMLGQVEFPAGAFTYLRLLLVQDVPLQYARHLLMAQPLIDNIEVLRLQICDDNDLEDLENEETHYVRIYQRLAAIPHLQQLTFASSRPESMPYPFPFELLQPVLRRRLTVLRLFRVCILMSQGFQQLLTSGGDLWANLTELCIMHQDLVLQDLADLTRLPNIESLSGNVTHALAGHPRVIQQGFSRHLTFTSQYRCRQNYPNLEILAGQVSKVLDMATPNGMTVRIDRIFRRDNQIDRWDAAWARAISSRLKALGKSTPLYIPWST